MKRILLSSLAAISLVAAGSVLPAPFFAAPLSAQSNDNDYTPLNSRIRRDRQFPNSLMPRFDKERSKANRDRGRNMIGQLARCLYNRGKEQSLGLLEKTDYGFMDFQQVDMEVDRALRLFGFNDCMTRVAEINNSGVAVRFMPGNLREWLINAAYFDRFPREPGWIAPGNTIGERKLPLSSRNGGVLTALDISDCVVLTDPYGADYFYRTPAQSSEERVAVNELVPALSACIPEGVQFQFTPYMIRVMMGEGLWHASQNSVAGPAAANASQGEP